MSVRARLLLPLLLTTASCAWEAGESFATLEPTARVAFVPLADREAGDGWQKLDTDFQARVEAGSLRVAPLELVGGGGEGGAAGFDPAHPPPGYSGCHGGHCHAADGSLVSYEEIEAELGGGGGGSEQAVVTLALGEVDLLVPSERTLECIPGCELPRTEVQQLHWPVERLVLEGRVRDGRAAPRLAGERPFRVVLEAPEAGALVELTQALALSADRSEPPRIALALQLDVTAHLLDGLDWSTAEETDGVLRVDGERNAALRARVLENLAQLEPSAAVQRSGR